MAYVTIHVYGMQTSSSDFPEPDLGTTTRFTSVIGHFSSN
jgi:hypothetical protein